MAVTNKLTAFAVDRYKPTDKVQKISDGGGMYLQVNPNGSKWWRLAYRLNGKQQLKSLGVYPKVSLADARKKRDAFDPNPPLAGKTLNKIFEDFMKIQKSGLTNKHQSWVASRCSPILTALGSRPIKSLRAPDFLEHIRVIEQRTKIVARQVKSDFDQCYEYAISCGDAETNPVKGLNKALMQIKRGHRPAIKNPDEIKELLKMIYLHPSIGVVDRYYQLIAPHVFVRPGELRLAKWSQIDFDAALWSYNMGEILHRDNTDHIVPLSSSVLAMLREIHKFTGHTENVFASVPSEKPISDMTATQFLRRTGWSKKHCMHGWRATARTLLDEKFRYRIDIIEHQLGHLVRDPLGRAYNRTEFLEDRRLMMQAWSEFLVSLCPLMLTSLG